LKTGNLYVSGKSSALTTTYNVQAESKPDGEPATGTKDWHKAELLQQCFYCVWQPQVD
jgi:hypothetical protein